MSTCICVHVCTYIHILNTYVGSKKNRQPGTANSGHVRAYACVKCIESYPLSTESNKHGYRFYYDALIATSAEPLSQRITSINADSRTSHSATHSRTRKFFLYTEMPRHPQADATSRRLTRRVPHHNRDVRTHPKASYSERRRAMEVPRSSPLNSRPARTSPVMSITAARLQR